jgi:hypothetical protein
MRSARQLAFQSLDDSQEHDLQYTRCSTVFIETLFRVKVKNILGFIVENTVVDGSIERLSRVASFVTMIDEREHRIKNHHRGECRLL